MCRGHSGIGLGGDLTFTLLWAAFVHLHTHVLRQIADMWQNEIFSSHGYKGTLNKELQIGLVRWCLFPSQVLAFFSNALAEVDMNSLDVGVASGKNAQGSDSIDGGVKTRPTCPVHTGRTRVRFPIVCSLQTVHSSSLRVRS